MMRKFTTLSLALLILCFGAELSFAQKGNQKLKFPKVHQKSTPASEKVASHDDTPGSMMAFDWTTGWDTSGQFTYTYTPSGNISSYQYDYYTSSMFNPSNKYIYTYDGNGREVEYLQLYWNGAAWENSARSTTSYDSRGNTAEYIYQSWVLSAWETLFGNRYSRMYNVSNQITEEIIEDYNTTSMIWENLDKTNFTYGANGWTGYDYATWNGSAWAPDSRIINVTWHNFAKDLPLTATFQQWNGTSYDDTDRLTTTYSQYDSYIYIYEVYSGIWSNDYKSVGTFDAEEHQIASQEYSWSGSWVLDYESQAIFTYDTQGRTLEAVYRDQNASGVLENSYRELFSSFFVGATAPVTPNVSLTAYPVPATTQLNFDVELSKNGPVSITLFDLQGRKRMETMTYYNGNTLTLPLDESLENGAYFYQLSAGDAFAKGKVLIQR